MPDRLEERLSRLPKGWDVVPPGGLPTARLIGYGITRPGEHTDSGVGTVRAADVQDGRLYNDEPKRISRQVHEAGLRSQLEVGDVVVVLVGRVGEAAIVTEEFHHWNASRTVGSPAERQASPVPDGAKTPPRPSGQRVCPGFPSGCIKGGRRAGRHESSARRRRPWSACAEAGVGD
jgi:hypothetical protein